MKCPDSRFVSYTIVVFVGLFYILVSSQTPSQSQATSSVAPSTRHVSPSTPNPTPPSKSSSAHKPTSSGVVPHTTKSHHGSMLHYVSPSNFITWKPLLTFPHIFGQIWLTSFVNDP